MHLVVTLVFLKIHLANAGFWGKTLIGRRPAAKLQRWLFIGGFRGEAGGPFGCYKACSYTG